MICFGDVDASYAPTAKSVESLFLVYEGTQLVPSFTEFDLEVKIKQPAQVGAISLGFYYPEEFLEVIGAELPDGNTNIVFNAEDGLFRIAWCDLSSLNVNGDEVLLIIKMKSKDLTGLTAGIELSLFEDCELADGMANVIDDVTISIPVIQSLMTGIDNPSAQISLKAYPNPFSNKTTISISMLEEGNVSLALYDMMGNLVLNLSEVDLTEGNHQIELNAESLESGIYMLKTVIKNNDREYSKMIKMVVSK